MSPSVLYYSIVFPDQYDVILHHVYTIALSSTDNDEQGLFIKTNLSFDAYFKTVLTNETKKNIVDTFPHIQKLKEGDIFMVFNNVIYKINSEFHITTLFSDGKQTELTEKYDALGCVKTNVVVDSFAISKEFITLSVASVSTQYNGNNTIHITFGLSLSGAFKLFPKDSPSALSNGIKFDGKLELNGITSFTEKKQNIKKK
ncbi:hypothetical protein BMW23_1013 [Bodo saltans virus]|uniref:Uncharacterized protein n=1 Tax=Bodo saltans virus TaxID=2024608 RepID=A0A2H4UVU5_9VIRU|nr:hypothetical protein QJ851_gp0995 [Bodo saltans virus]ATZ81058.1 hypothetical protein BMW23_1013 [Bodo saltans virus]